MIRSVIAVLTVLALAACSGNDDDGGSSPGSSPGSEPADARDRYVALGDSFTAAPGVPPQVGGACGRSGVNYPSLVAESLGLALTDVSCSGADSAGVLAQQVPAVADDAAAVTVSVGGNDDGLFARLAFGTLDRRGVAATLRTVERNVGEVVDAVTAAAPDARVVVVSYPRLLPASGTCPDRVPFATGDYRFVDRVNRGLVEAQRRAAAKAGVGFADVYAASEGHDICSDEPWVNGADTAPDGTIPFHPFAVGQAGMADVVEAVLSR